LCPFIVADLADFGETLDALSSVDVYGRLASSAFNAIVHLAAIPAARRFSDPVTFRNNTLSTYNVFECRASPRDQEYRLGIKRDSAGAAFETAPPYVPVDEECARPESAYSLSKLLSEEMAKQFCRWDPEMKIIGLRFSNVMEPGDYAAFPDFEQDPHGRKWNLWGYIARDAARRSGASKCHSKRRCVRDRKSRHGHVAPEIQPSG
jgi:nucleoside-diphosphate-sugar epimerase